MKWNRIVTDTFQALKIQRKKIISFCFIFFFDLQFELYLIYKVSSIWSNSNLPIPPPNFHFLSKKKNCFRLRSIAYLLNHSYWSDMLVQRKVKSMKRQDMKLIYWETDAGDPRILLRHNPHKMSDITCGNLKKKLPLRSNTNQNYKKKAYELNWVSFSLKEIIIIF